MHTKRTVNLFKVYYKEFVGEYKAMFKALEFQIFYKVGTENLSSQILIEANLEANLFENYLFD